VRRRGFFALGTILLLALAQDQALGSEENGDWQDTPQSLRMDDSAVLCTYAPIKAELEKAIRDERAYSKKYGVTDLGKLNHLKHRIQALDTGMAAAAVGLRKRSQAKISCTSPLLIEFVGCIDDDSDEDFRAMQENEKSRNCHARGFGVPASPASPQDLTPQDLAPMATRIPATQNELSKAQSMLAKAGVASESMNMALVCASDVSVISRRPITTVATDFADIMGLRSPLVALRRLGLPLNEALSDLETDGVRDANMVARLVEDRGFEPSAILSSVCSAVAKRQDGGQLGEISMAARNKAASSH